MKNYQMLMLPIKELTTIKWTSMVYQWYKYDKVRGLQNPQKLKIEKKMASDVK